MSGVTRLTQVGTYLRLEFCDGLSINWAEPARPGGVPTGEDHPARAYAHKHQEGLARMVAALEPLLVAIAADAGGTLLPCDHPDFSARRQVIDLRPALGGVSTLSLEVALPRPLDEPARDQVYACVREVWEPRRVRKADRPSPGVPPWEAFPHLGPGSLGWRTGEGEQFLAAWSPAFTRLTLAERVSYRAAHPAPFYWFWFYWPYRSPALLPLIVVLAVLTFPLRLIHHRARRARRVAV